MILAATIPILCFALIFLIFAQGPNRIHLEQRRRGAFLSAAIAWGFLATMLTEVLSLFDRFQSGWLALGWLLSTGAASLIYLRVAERSRNVIDLAQFRSLSFANRILILGIIFTTAMVGVTAIVAPPNTWDSMAYHMSRVAHWVDVRGVAHYPTNIIRQLYMNPWTEFTIAHFQILVGGDRMANLVQWSAMIGAILAVSMLADQFGATKKGQILAGVFALSIPLLLIQGSSTKNDLTVAFWLTCLYAFGLAALKNGFHRWTIFFAGLALGLALLTKGTAYIYALPMVIWLIVAALREKRADLVPVALLAFLLILAINSGHFMRNYRTFGNILGIEGHFVSERFGTRVLASSLLRNLSLHMATSVPSIDSVLEESIIQVHRWMQADVNDPLTTSGGDFSIPALISDNPDQGSVNLIRKDLLNESGSASPLHLAAIVLASLIVILVAQLRSNPMLAGYLLALVTAFVLFSLLLRWQPWNSRLHLPLLVMWSPLIGIAFTTKSLSRISSGFGILLLLLAFIAVIGNLNRPWIGTSSIFRVERQSQYFRSRPDVEEPYRQASALVADLNCHHVGLNFSENDWEYPLWILMNLDAEGKTSFTHVIVDNPSSQLISQSSPPPCAILSTDNKRFIRIQDLRFERTHNVGSLFVLLPKEIVTSP